MTEILDIIGKLLGAAVVGAIFYLLPKVKLWLTEKTGKENAEQIMTLVTAFVKAADQLYKADDPTGAVRNAYVKEQITKLGVAVTDEINAYIEAAVLELK